MIKSEVTFLFLSETLNTSLDTESYIVPPIFRKVGDSGIIPTSSSSYSALKSATFFSVNINNHSFPVFRVDFGTWSLFP